MISSFAAECGKREWFAYEDLLWQEWSAYKNPPARWPDMISTVATGDQYCVVCHYSALALSPVPIEAEAAAPSTALARASFPSFRHMLQRPPDSGASCISELVLHSPKITTTSVYNHEWIQQSGGSLWDMYADTSGIGA